MNLNPSMKERSAESKFAFFVALVVAFIIFSGIAAFCFAATGFDFSFYQNLPKLQNGKIVDYVQGGGLIVAIKTASGADPSSSNPVSVVINGATRSITSAISFNASAGGGNYLDSANVLRAGQRQVYFVYLCWDTSYNHIVLLVNRYPYAQTNADFNTNNQNENGFLNSSGFAVNSTDKVLNIGYFSASMSSTTAWYLLDPSDSFTNSFQSPGMSSTTPFFIDFTQIDIALAWLAAIVVFGLIVFFISS